MCLTTLIVLLPIYHLTITRQQLEPIFCLTAYLHTSLPAYLPPSLLIYLPTHSPLPLSLPTSLTLPLRQIETISNYVSTRGILTLFDDVINFFKPT